MPAQFLHDGMTWKQLQRMQVIIWTVNIIYASMEDISGRDTSRKSRRISCIRKYNKHNKLLQEHRLNSEQNHIRDI